MDKPDMNKEAGDVEMDALSPETAHLLEEVGRIRLSDRQAAEQSESTLAAWVPPGVVRLGLGLPYRFTVEEPRSLATHVEGLGGPASTGLERSAERVARMLASAEKHRV
jgi:hypothetical protein